jgi:hypothetical protein
MSSAIYFRSLAARCHTSARDCGDYFAKEEFHRLAHEFQTRAEQLESSRSPTEISRWPTKPEQARGFEGDH